MPFQGSVFTGCGGRRGWITNFRYMFDRIMENSMALWMLVSALFPIFVFGTLIKAFLHYRRMRALERMVIPDEILPAQPLRHERVDSEDWVPSR